MCLADAGLVLLPFGFFFFLLLLLLPLLLLLLLLLLVVVVVVVVLLLLLLSPPPFFFFFFPLLLLLLLLLLLILLHCHRCDWKETVTVKQSVCGFFNTAQTTKLSDPRQGSAGRVKSLV